jgi:hypothetical protein
MTSRPCCAPWSYPVLRRAGTEHPLRWPGQQPPGLQATALHTHALSDCRSVPGTAGTGVADPHWFQYQFWLLVPDPDP